jgi:hypothetical protein
MQKIQRSQALHTADITVDELRELLNNNGHALPTEGVAYITNSPDNNGIRLCVLVESGLIESTVAVMAVEKP